jgi:hypothetical protein
VLGRLPPPRLPLYYFNVEDGQRLLDDTGLELPDIAAARDEVVRTSGNLLKAGPSSPVWNGIPWRLWVTDQPNGEGKTFFTLRFSADM